MDKEKLAREVADIPSPHKDERWICPNKFAGAMAILNHPDYAIVPREQIEDCCRCVDNVYDHINHEAYNDALSSSLEIAHSLNAMLQSNEQGDT